MPILSKERTLLQSPLRKPRKNSEAYWDTLCFIDSETRIIDDAWLHEWTGQPPEPFIRYRTIFRQCTPDDIAKHDWAILTLAVKEISNIFGIQKPEAKADADVRLQQLSKCKFEWLSLNQAEYHARPCLMGIYKDEYVVAAVKPAIKCCPFVPLNYYQILRENNLWKNLRYRVSYRHFQAMFDIGYCFYSDQQNLFCSVDYSVSTGVYGRSYLAAAINVDGVWLAAPEKIPLAADLSDLPEKIEQVNTRCRLFVHRLGTTWLKGYGGDAALKLIRCLTAASDVPMHALDSLRNDSALDKCATRLDVLRCLMHAVNLRTAQQCPPFIRLSQKFVH